MIAQPEPKREVLARREAIVAGLRALLPESGVIAEPLRLKPYETDGLAAYKQVPLAVALPESTEQVAAVLAFLHNEGVRVVPRGAGTSLSGGALPMADAVVVGMMRMNRILDIDYGNRFAVVQPGVTNIGITNAVSDEKLLLCARPVEPARLHDRRQCRDELRRRPLPALRRDRQQPARRQAGDDGRRGDRDRRPASRCRRLRLARPAHRQRGPAWHRHRSHRAHPALARGRAGDARGVPRQRDRRRSASMRSSARASSRWRWSSWTGRRSTPARHSRMPAIRSTPRRC